MEAENLSMYPHDLGKEIERQQKELGLPKPKERHALDGKESRRRYRMVREWWEQAKVSLADWRADAARDYDIYDGDQWREEDAQELLERGQAPLVFNFVKPTVDWLLGSEKRMRVDYACMPRGPEDAQLAEVKTKLLKYLQDCNLSEFCRSRAFEDAVIAGVGWTEHGWSDDGDADSENVYERYEDWRNIWWDHKSVEMDLSDARYIFRGKWMDLDIACAHFPDRADVLRGQAMRDQTDYGEGAFGETDSGLYSEVEEEPRYTSTGFSGTHEDLENRRPRVFIVECWYRTPARKKVLRGEALGALSGIDFDPASEAQQQLLASGLANVYDFLGQEVRVMLFTGDKVLVDSASPYRHRRFPFVPWWGFKKRRTGHPYGIVRNLRDIQDDLNKRRSKALFVLSTNKMVAEDDAFEDWDVAADEMQRPDGILRHKKGSKVELHSDRSLASEHVALMQADEHYIQSVSGITDELMGRETNAVSGKAIEARQQQGQTITAKVFDNYRLAFKISGDVQLSLVEQFFTDTKSVRITGERMSAEFLEVNATDPQTGEMINDISAARADFVVDQHDYSASVRQTMFETMTEMLPGLPPEVQVGILDLVFDISDLPGKDEFVQRIREITGHHGKDEDRSPEEMQAEMAAQQQQAEMEAQAQALQMQELEAKVQQGMAQAEKAAMETQLIREKIQTERVEQQVKQANVRLQEAKQVSESENKQANVRLQENKQAVDVAVKDREFEQREKEKKEVKTNETD